MIRNRFFRTVTGRTKQGFLRLGILVIMTASWTAGAGASAYAALPQTDIPPTPEAVQTGAQPVVEESSLENSGAVVWPWKQENPEPKARRAGDAQAAELTGKGLGNEISAKAVDSANGITSVGQTGGASFRVAVSGENAYLGTGFKLTVLKASNPAALEVIGKTTQSWTDEVLGIAVRENYAYIAAGNEGLRVVDLTDPKNPVEAGFYNTPGYAWDVFVSGDFAYVADGEDGLQIIDISTAYAPQFRAVLNTPGIAMDIVVAGSSAYIADESEGLRIADVSNPASPSEVGSLNTPGRAVGLAVAGSVVFIADDTSGLRVVDASNRTAPKEIGSLDTAGNAYAVDINPITNTAYIADSGNGLRAVDITTKTAPKEIGHFDVAGCWANDVIVSGSYAYMVDTAHGLRVLNITNPSELSQVMLFNSPAPTDVKVLNQIAYVPAGSAGLRVLDVKNPAAPLEAGYFDTPGYAYAVDVFAPLGSDKIFVAVADWDKGLRIIDASKASAPYEIGSLDTTGMARDVVVRFPYAYVADDNSGLQIIDLSSPAAPQLVGTCAQGECLPSGGSARGLAISAPSGLNPMSAYVADGEKGLQLINVSDPVHPVLLGFYETPGEANDVSLSPSHPYAYVADGFNGGLQVVDISNPAGLVSLGAYDTDGSVNALLSVRAADSTAQDRGDYVFIADGLQGLRVIAVEPQASGRPALSEKGFYDTRGWAGSLNLVGKRIFVADGEDGIRILEVPSAWVPHVISGKVTDDQGQPLSGVEISSAGGLTTTTDANGAYSLTGLLSEDVTITPALAGYLFSPGSFTIHIEDDLYNRDFAGSQYLGDKHFASGKVVDAQGTALTGVEIAVTPASGGNSSAPMANNVVLTDNRGAYNLSGLAEGTYTLKPGKAGYIFSPPFLTVTLALTEGQLTLNDENPIEMMVGNPTPVSGLVTDVQNKPLADVQLTGDCGVQVHTGMDGKFNLEDLTREPCVLTPSLEGYAFSPEKRLVGGADSMVNQDFIALENGSFLSGQVIDGEENPVRDVQVQSDCGLAGVTDMTGQFRLAIIDKLASTCKITLQKSGYSFVPANWIVNLADSTGEADGNLSVVKRFRAVSKRIAGQVFDIQGKPLAGVVLSLNTGETVQTDKEGRYSFQIDKEGNYVITPVLAGATFTPPSLTVSLPARQDMNFYQGYEVQGNITDEAGVPLAGVTVREENNATGGVLTDDQGHYSLAVREGPSILVAEKRGLEFKPVKREIKVPPVVLGQDFVATFTNLTMHGRVMDVQGAPIVGAAISDGNGHTAVTDANGTYSLTGEKGKFQLIPVKEGFHFEPTSLDMTLPTQTDAGYDFLAKINELALTGKVIAVDGSPLTGVTLTSSTGKQATTDGTGIFSLMETPGSIRLTPQKEGYTFSPIMAEITLSESAAVDSGLLQFTGEGIDYTVTGTVQEQDGSPLSGVVLIDGTTEAARTDRQGNYSITRKTGDYAFNLTKDGYNFLPAVLTLHLPAQTVGNGQTQALVSATPLCPNAILNGSFEKDEGWGISEGKPGAASMMALETAYRGERAGVLLAGGDGKSASGHTFLRQKVTIPKGAKSATIRFSLYPYSEKGLDKSGDSQLVLLLDQNQKEKERLVNIHSDERQWKSYQVDLTRYAGQTLWVYFGTYNNGKDGTVGLNIDDVSLQICENE